MSKISYKFRKVTIVYAKKMASLAIGLNNKNNNNNYLLTHNHMK